MRRGRWIAALALGLSLVAPDRALAAGGPVLPMQGNAIAAPAGPARYLALAAGRDTVIQRQAPSGRASLRVAGRYGIPAADYAGTLTGLSADGRTLIVADIDPNIPPQVTRLLVLDAPRLAVRARIALRGWWTVDALSPDGHWLYLIHYTSPSDLTRYEVRSYDLRAQRLVPGPLPHPNDGDGPMFGLPVARTMGTGERWVYTFYFRPSGAPFIHALDTVGRRTVCIDLPSLGNVDTSNLHLVLGPGGASVQIVSGAAIDATVNTRTFAVTSVPGALPAPASGPAGGGSGQRAHAPHPRHGAGAPWVVILAALAVLGAGVARIATRARREPLDAHAEGEHELVYRVVVDEEVPVR